VGADVGGVRLPAGLSFSFSSSVERCEVEVAIKALGDFTSTVDGLEPGTKVYVDGPHGAFSIDQDEGPGSR
jgi:predicted ferric reductase